MATASPGDREQLQGSSGSGLDSPSSSNATPFRAVAQEGDVPSGSRTVAYSSAESSYYPPSQPFLTSGELARSVPVDGVVSEQETVGDHRGVALQQPGPSAPPPLPQRLRQTERGDSGAMFPSRSLNELRGDADQSATTFHLAVFPGGSREQAIRNGFADSFTERAALRDSIAHGLQATTAVQRYLRHQSPGSSLAASSPFLSDVVQQQRGMSSGTARHGPQLARRSPSPEDSQAGWGREAAPLEGSPAPWSGGATQRPLRATPSPVLPQVTQLVYDSAILSAAPSTPSLLQVPLGANRQSEDDLVYSSSRAPSQGHCAFFTPLVASSAFSDVTLVTFDKTYIPAHKCILSAVSPMFRTMFLSKCHFVENTAPQVHIPFTTSTFQPVLHFIYTGELPVVPDAVELLSAANYFTLDTLKAVATQLLKSQTNRGNCFFHLSVALEYMCAPLRDHCVSLLRQLNMNVLRSRRWCRLPLDVALLLMQETVIEGELMILHRCYDWCLYNSLRKYREREASSRESASHTGTTRSGSVEDAPGASDEAVRDSKGEREPCGSAPAKYASCSDISPTLCKEVELTPPLPADFSVRQVGLSKRCASDADVATGSVPPPTSSSTVPQTPTHLDGAPLPRHLVIADAREGGDAPPFLVTPCTLREELELSSEDEDHFPGNGPSRQLSPLSQRRVNSGGDAGAARASLPPHGSSATTVTGGDEPVAAERQTLRGSTGGGPQRCPKLSFHPPPPLTSSMASEAMDLEEARSNPEVVELARETLLHFIPMIDFGAMTAEEIREVEEENCVPLSYLYEVFKSKSLGLPSRYNARKGGIVLQWEMTASVDVEVRNNHVAKRTADYAPVTICAINRFTIGSHYWTVHILDLHSPHDCFVGVTNRSMQVSYLYEPCCLSVHAPPGTDVTVEPGPHRSPVLSAENSGIIGILLDYSHNCICWYNHVSQELLATARPSQSHRAASEETGVAPGSRGRRDVDPSRRRSLAHLPLPLYPSAVLHHKSNGGVVLAETTSFLGDPNAGEVSLRLLVKESRMSPSKWSAAASRNRMTMNAA